MIARPFTASLFVLAAHSMAAAQGLPSSTTVSSAALYARAQLSTDFDQGGSFSWGGLLASGSVLHQFTPQFAAGVSLRYEYQDWHFSNPVAFGGTAPWNNLNFPQVGAAFVYTPAEDWRLALIPTVEWAYENGASTGDALNYGAVVTAARVLSPGLTLGLGAAVYHQIYTTKVFPFPVVDWKIDGHWKLTNPFQAGPAGGAGLELTYAFNDRWEMGAGGSYRSLVYRLAADGPVGNGIGENKFIPLFLRVSYQLEPRTQLDFYAAALTGGKLTVKNASGNDVTNDAYQTAPALGVTLQTRF
jgi:hypothetical protein